MIDHPEWPSKTERENAVWAFREVRRQHWDRPLVVADGQLVAKALPEELVLPWEDPDSVAEQELPDYQRLGWYVENSPVGLLLHGPHRIPELLDHEQLLQPVVEEVSAAEPVEPEPEIVLLDGVAVVASNGDDPASTT